MTKFKCLGQAGWVFRLDHCLGTPSCTKLLLAYLCKSMDRDSCLDSAANTAYDQQQFKISEIAAD